MDTRLIVTFSTTGKDYESSERSGDTKHTLLENYISKETAGEKYEI